LIEEPVKLLASRIEGTLLVLLGFHGVEEWAAFVIDSVAENPLDAFPS